MAAVNIFLKCPNSKSSTSLLFKTCCYSYFLKQNFFSDAPFWNNNFHSTYLVNLGHKKTLLYLLSLSYPSQSFQSPMQWFPPTYDKVFQKIPLMTDSWILESYKDRLKQLSIQPSWWRVFLLINKHKSIELKNKSEILVVKSYLIYIYSLNPQDSWGS